MPSTVKQADSGRAHSGKVAFVTGAAGGIGRATAVAFAAEGADVALVDLDESGALQTAAMVEAAGVRALSVVADVTRSEDVKTAVDRTLETFGRLDFAFNNAGIEHPYVKTHDITEDLWDRIVNVDLRSVFLCMKHQIPIMLEQGGGVIVNTSSGAGVAGFAGQAAYTAAKHGVVGLTKSAALDYVTAGVRVNAVCPGLTDTPMIERLSGGTEEGRAAVIAQEPIGRMARPEEIAATVLWLCSDGAAFVVGQAIVVDGGQTG